MIGEVLITLESWFRPEASRFGGRLLWTVSGNGC